MITELLLYILLGILITGIAMGLLFTIVYVYYSAQERPWIGIGVFGAVIGALLYLINPFKF